MSLYSSTLYANATMGTYNYATISTLNNYNAVIIIAAAGSNSATNNVWFRGALIPYGEGLN